MTTVSFFLEGIHGYRNAAESRSDRELEDLNPEHSHPEAATLVTGSLPVKRPIHWTVQVDQKQCV